MERRVVSKGKSAIFALLVTVLIGHYEAPAQALTDLEKELLEAMRRFQSDPEERDRCARNGYEAYQKNWTEEAHIGEYLSIVNEQIEKRKAREAERSHR